MLVMVSLGKERDIDSTTYLLPMNPIQLAVAWMKEEGVLVIVSLILLCLGHPTTSLLVTHKYTHRDDEGRLKTGI